MVLSRWVEVNTCQREVLAAAVLSRTSPVYIYSQVATKRIPTKIFVTRYVSHCRRSSMDNKNGDFGDQLCSL
jgi:hypothetical protein